MGGFGVFLLLLFFAFVLYMIIGAVLQGLKGATGLEVGCLYLFFFVSFAVAMCFDLYFLGHSTSPFLA